jgi:hypothetical protein
MAVGVCTAVSPQLSTESLGAKMAGRLASMAGRVWPWLLTTVQQQPAGVVSTWGVV